MKPFVVGLTGSIGAGKSTVAGLLARRGAFVVDADALGHEALQTCREAILARFGPEILEGDTISRSRLGRIVFADPAKRRELEKIVHPEIRRQAQERIAASGAAVVVLDAALLLEAGWDEVCDAILYVDAPRELRLERVKSRSGWDESTLIAREAAQLPLARKQERANHVIMNDSSVESLSRRVAPLAESWGL